MCYCLIRHNSSIQHYVCLSALVKGTTFRFVHKVCSLIVVLSFPYVLIFLDIKGEEHGGVIPCLLISNEDK